MDCCRSVNASLCLEDRNIIKLLLKKGVKMVKERKKGEVVEERVCLLI